jgi:predicted Na+-dependent transporter
MQVFATGLGAAWHDAFYLFLRPRLLASSVLARNVAVPVIAVLLIKTFPFSVEMAITLGVLGWKAFRALAGNGSLLAIAIFIVAGTAVGHFLGGRRPADRTALAIATPARHPGLAVAIAQANYPQQSRLVAGAVVIYLILRMPLLFLYTRWRHPPDKEV